MTLITNYIAPEVWVKRERDRVLDLLEREIEKLPADVSGHDIIRLLCFIEELKKENEK